ncbi:MAG: HAMP domain-containing sensor histidine kinase, partial [Eggerthellales bacterium]|nr:HAMP domain-containing sensor histidine kinase [Eggerthellales bacterium]
RRRLPGLMSGPARDAARSPARDAARGSVRFGIGPYLTDRRGAVALIVLCAAAIFVMTRVFGVTSSGQGVCAAAVLTFGVLGLTWDYLRKKPFIQSLEQAGEGLEHAYYLAEMLPEPRDLEGRIFVDALAEACRADAWDLQEEKARHQANRRFVDLWTHEIKTPIAAAELTLARMHGPDAASLRTDLDRIKEACERALYNTRVDTVSADYSLDTVGLLGLCKEVCIDMSNLLISSGLTPSFEISDTLQVVTDPGWARFVIRQCLSNSAKYGAGRVHFSAWEEQPGTPSGRVALRLADDGCGIAAEEVPHVFELGFCGTNGRDGQASTGMGLYLSAQACAAMGVQMSLSSQEGEGTSVTLRFPCDVSVLER